MNKFNRCKYRFKKIYQNLLPIKWMYDKWHAFDLYTQKLISCDGISAFLNLMDFYNACNSQ